MKFNIRPIATLALLAALGVSSLVIAHPGGMGMGPMGGMHGPRAMMMADPAAMADQHLTDAKAALKITADQETAWQTFAGKARQQAAEMPKMRDQMLQMQGSAPERMNQHAEAMKSQVGHLESMSTALRDLYAVLSPEQKAVADQQFLMMRGQRMAIAR
jgi:hypothetical protein